MKLLRVSLRPELFCKLLYSSKDAVLAELSCSFSASHSHTFVPFYCRPLSLSARAELTFRLPPPCRRHMLAHKLLEVHWCSYSGVYISVTSSSGSELHPPAVFFYLMSTSDFDGGISSQSHQSRVETPSESVISNRVRRVRVCVCVAAGVSGPAHQGLSRIKVAKVSGLYSS